VTRDRGATAGPLTPVWIVVYLALHAIWAQFVFGAYAFVYLRILFLIGIASLLFLRGRGAEIHRYFVGAILPRNGLAAFALMLLLLLAARFAEVGLRVWFHAAPTYGLDRLFAECFVAPINEEILFRGLFLGILIQRFPDRPMLAIAVSVLAYVSVHDLVRQNAFSLELFLTLSALGVLLGWIYFRTRSVLCCILAHSLWNAFAFISFSRFA